MIKTFLMRIFGFFVIAVSINLTVLSAFFSLPLPTGLKSVIETASLICIIGPVIGGCLIAYGSEWSMAFSQPPVKKRLCYWCL